MSMSMYININTLIIMIMNMDRDIDRDRDRDKDRDRDGYRDRDRDMNIGRNIERGIKIDKDPAKFFSDGSDITQKFVLEGHKGSVTSSSIIVPIFQAQSQVAK
jgi:hypothetical protein